MIGMVPEKLANSVTQLPILGLTRRVGVLVMATILAMLLVCSIDHSTVTMVVDFWRYPSEFLTQKVDSSPKFPSLHTETNQIMIQSPNLSVSPHNSTQLAGLNSTQVSTVNENNVVLPRTGNPEWESQSSEVDSGRLSGESGPELVNRGDSGLSWVSVGLEENYTSNLMSRWLEPGGEPCKDSKTVEIKFLNFDDENPVVLSTGNAHEVVFQAVDELGDSHCVGGDYLEVGLAGELWRSRPPTKDLGNGTYSFTLQVHPDFAGSYNLTIILLFRHFEGLKFSTARFGYDKQLRSIPIEFSKFEAKLPDLQMCGESDFGRDLWAGRWTRHAKNDGCEISNDGRYRCLEPEYPCTNPWCNGSLGLIESNGWVYSAHCYFKIFSADDAWNCLNNRWLFFWGDSNHVDTIRNILFFFLRVPFQELEVVSRRFDQNFTNPRNRSQSVRITNIFNGHSDMTKNYEGLDSLSNEGYRDLLKSFFNGSSVPDTVIFNSGLHDGIHWHTLRRFVSGAEYAASFWKELMDGVKERGLEVSKFIFRSTITTGGYARTLSFNPSKMEAFNGILLEKLKEAGLVTGVIDDFDMTWAWHYDNRCNDGVHYGRFPAKMRWRDGQIGHQYFVDLMLGQVLFNAICQR